MVTHVPYLYSKRCSSPCVYYCYLFRLYVVLFMFIRSVYLYIYLINRRNKELSLSALSVPLIIH